VWSLEGLIIVAMKMAEGSAADMLEVYLAEFGTGVEGPQICNMMTQAARGIDFLNAKTHTIDNQKVGIQHCSIKPGNLLLFGETVRLTDFGMAVPTGSTLKMHRRVNTLDYAAPEVFRGRLTDFSDQYSLGVTYFHLRTGKLPYPETPAQIPFDYIRPDPDLSPLPPAERSIIARAVNKVAQQRWPNCSDMAAQLAKVVT
jgi:serine/threonine protein kinase